MIANKHYTPDYVSSTCRYKGIEMGQVEQRVLNTLKRNIGPDVVIHRLSHRLDIIDHMEINTRTVENYVNTDNVDVERESSRIIIRIDE